MKAYVNEIFYSLSGEGVSAGIPTIFIRLAGCSLRCGKSENSSLWCDTPYSLGEKMGELMDIPQILNEIIRFPVNTSQILITGGEPLTGEKKNFCQKIAKVLYKMRHNKDNALIRIETNGSESIEGLTDMVFSLDYKLPSSYMEKFMDLKNLELLNLRNHFLDEVKFIVRDRLDFDRSLEIVNHFQLNTNLIYSPVYGELSSQELAEWLKECPLSKARLSIPLHKILWGSKRGV